MGFFWRGFKSSLSSPIKCSNDTLSVRRNKRSTRKKNGIHVSKNVCRLTGRPLLVSLPPPCSLEPCVRRHCIPGRCFPFCQTAMMINRDRGALVKFLCPLCPQQIVVQVSVCMCVCVSVSWLSSALWIFITTFARGRLSDVNSLRRSCRRCLLLLIAKLLPFTSHPLPLPLLLLPPSSCNLTFKWIM